MSISKNPFWIASNDAFREVYGDPRRVNISSQAENDVENVIKSSNIAKDTASQDALRYVLGKQAEMAEKINVPTRRIIDPWTRVEPEFQSGFDGHYSRRNDTVYLEQIPPNIRRLGKEEIRRHLARTAFHEFIHRLLARPVGRPFERNMQRKYQYGVVGAPYQIGDDDRDELMDNANGWSLLYREPWEKGAPFYGTEDFGRGYPSEMLSTVAESIVDAQSVSKPMLKILKKMLKSVQQKSRGDALVLSSDLYRRQTYDHHQSKQIETNVLLSMRNLATTQELLRNKLAILQNQTMGLLRLRDGNRTDEVNKILANNAVLGITTPSFFKTSDGRAYLDALRHPVCRQPDPIMHQESMGQLVDSQGRNINSFWETPSISWGRPLIK